MICQQKSAATRRSKCRPSERSARSEIVTGKNRQGCRMRSCGRASTRENPCFNCYDLQYAPTPQAQPFSFGLGNLWRIAVEYPDSPVPHASAARPRPCPASRRGCCGSLEARADRSSQSGSWRIRFRPRGLPSCLVDRAISRLRKVEAHCSDGRLRVAPRPSSFFRWPSPVARSRTECERIRLTL